MTAFLCGFLVDNGWKTYPFPNTTFAPFSSSNIKQLFHKEQTYLATIYGKPDIFFPSLIVNVVVLIYYAFQTQKIIN